MMQPRIAELLLALDHERSSLLTVADTLPRERWNERVAPDRWSVADILWHLHRTETNIAGLIAKRAAKARADGHATEMDERSVLQSLDGLPIADRSRKIVSPSSISPTEPIDSDAVLALLEASRTQMRQALTSADGLAIGTITHPHPAFGELDLYQWALFVAQHERRHAGQITETIASLVTSA